MSVIWQKKPNAKIDIDDVVAIIDETPLAIHVEGEGPAFGTYVLGRFDFFNNFTEIEG